MYFGELNAEGKRHSKGVMVYANGRRYEGNWKDDVRHGRGYERHANQNVYIGEFFEGKVQGHGQFKWANGEEFDGQWVQGVRHGKGIWKGIHSNNVYVGDWCKNRSEGYGTYTWPNGEFI